MFAISLPRHQFTPLRVLLLSFLLFFPCVLFAHSAVQTERVTANVSLQPGTDAILVYERKRPLKMHMEITLNGESFMRVYDGKSTGWVYNPFAPNAAVAPMTAPEIRDAADESDMDGPFVDYKAKGNQLEYLGMEDIAGKPARKLKLTAKSGEVSYCFFDSTTGFILRIQSTRKIKDADVPWETNFHDFREVEGLQYPFLVESGAVGSDQIQKIAATKIEINIPLDDSRFEKPVPPPPPTQPADPAKSN